MHRTLPNATIVGPHQVPDVTGHLIVIDVIRAFSVACRIWEHHPASYELTSDVAYALSLRDANPETVVLGEVGGDLPPGFDYQNNPIEPDWALMGGRPMVHRSSNGTAAVANATQAASIWCASFLNARATVEALQAQGITNPTFVATGIYFREGPLSGDEDIACAEYIAAMMAGEEPNVVPYLQRVLDSASGVLFKEDPSKDVREVYAACEINRYHHALRVAKREGRMFLEPVLHA